MASSINDGLVGGGVTCVANVTTCRCSTLLMQLGPEILNKMPSVNYGWESIGWVPRVLYALFCVLMHLAMYRLAHAALLFGA